MKQLALYFSLQSSLEGYQTLRPGIRLLLLCLLVSSCAVNTPTQTSGVEDNRVKLVENRSIDASIRRKFDQALEMLRGGEFQRAVVLLEDVAASTPDNSAPFINLGIAYAKLKEIDKAEASFKKALAINPDHPATLNEMALVYRSSGRFEEARKLYEKITLVHPEFMPARKNYGILCDLYLNDPNCALAQYEIYYQAYPQDEKIQLWIATLRRKMGNG